MRSALATALGALLAAVPALADKKETRTPAPPLKLHMLSGSKEYKSEPSLKALAAYLKKHYGIASTLSLGADSVKEFPNLDAMDVADVLVVFCRRTKITGRQLERVRKWCKAGKPVVGIRTASHAFQNWLAFDKEVLGGDYKGHGGGEKAVAVTLGSKAAGHPVLKGIEPWTRPGKLYRNPNLAADVTVLLNGKGAKDAQPLAWVRARKNGGRVFYTSMGGPADFQSEPFLRLLVNALHWTARRTAPKFTKPDVPAKPGG